MPDEEVLAELKSHIDVRKYSKKYTRRARRGRRLVILDEKLVANLLSEFVQTPPARDLLTRAFGAGRVHCVGAMAVTVNNTVHVRQQVHRDHSCGPGKTYTLAMHLDKQPLNTLFWDEDSDHHGAPSDVGRALFLYDASQLHAGSGREVVSDGGEDSYRLFVNFADPADPCFAKMQRGQGLGVKRSYPAICFL